MIEETKSNWDCVTQLQDKESSIDLGYYASYWMHKSPRRMLHSLSYYKFAAKMIGSKKRVVDLGCNEGLGSWLLAKECGFCKGVDLDAEAIQSAKTNFKDPIIEFSCEDVFSAQPSVDWDGVASFDLIEHIPPERGGDFFNKIAQQLTPNGVVVIGMPSMISQQFASEISRKGHLNIYSHERLRQEMEQFFEFVFLFSANDELIHTGFLPLAHYYIALGCKPIQSK